MSVRQLLLVSPVGVEALCDAALPGWQVTSIRDAAGLVEHLKSKRFLVALVDIGRLSEESAREISEAFALHSPHMGSVALLDHRNLESLWVRRLLAQNFRDYHSLPIDPSRLLMALNHAWRMGGIASDVARECEQAELGMVGSSGSMQRVYDTILKVAGADAPVLITGESGTGKELAAHAIHQQSDRASGPFVAVNCGALPANLVQSELFGHERGAFTGATERKIGRIEAADGGTLFLDEIGDLPMDLQVNLLRFLQEMTIERLGSRDSIQVDVRIIAATHVDLAQALSDHSFREDLYYRLNVLTLPMPALRERERDAEQLAEYFLRCFTASSTSPVRGFSRGALRVINSYRWPGNVRELYNRVQRAMVMCDKSLLSPEDLGLERRSEPHEYTKTLDEVRAQADRQAICSGLRRNQGNISHTAKSLGVSRVTLYRLLEKHAIKLTREPQMAD